MNVTKECVSRTKLHGNACIPSSTISEAARSRILSVRGEPLFLGDWRRVLMMHFEVNASGLQDAVPYQLDLYQGHAFVTLVAFTLENLRPRRGGKLGAWLFRPIATHDFLNVRTYVRQNGEPGIHFLAEWLSSWLAVQLGPKTFSLPYRYGHIQYQYDETTGDFCGRVADARTEAAFAYQATTEAKFPFSACKRGSLDEWLMERYAAFNSAGGSKRFFRVWHPPWPQSPVKTAIRDRSLLEQNWPWFKSASLTSANFSPGLHDVWMGRPHRA